MINNDARWVQWVLGLGVGVGLRGGWKTGNPRPCITSTPKLRLFLKKTQKSRKNERDSCIPWPKNGERPYLAVPEATFWGLFLGSFFGLFLHPTPILPAYFYFTFIHHQTIFYGIHTHIHISLHQSNKPCKKSMSKLYRMILGDDWDRNG